MKHEIKSTGWSFSSLPFPAFRGKLVLGATKTAQCCLPTKVTPITIYTVTSGREVVYRGTDKTAAEQCKSVTAGSNIGELISLPENTFEVIRTRAKETILIVPGKDSSNRCLLLTDHEGGFRGSVKIFEAGTTGKILTSCSTANACESKILVAAILEVGQKIAFHSQGRRTNDICFHSWDGTKITYSTMPMAEWSRPPSSDEIGSAETL